LSKGGNALAQRTKGGKARRGDMDMPGAF